MPETLVAFAQRSGRPAELLRGPLIYAVVSAVWTVVWWRESASGIVGLQALFLGDGFAGLIGGLVSDLGPSLAHRLQWSPDKVGLRHGAWLPGGTLGGLGSGKQRD